MGLICRASSSNNAHAITPGPVYGQLNQIYLAAQKGSKDEARQGFSWLPSEIKNKICALICDMADQPTTSGHPWGEVHAFDVIPGFQQAIHLVAVKEFDAMTTDQKRDVESEVYRIAESSKTSDDMWGKHHAKESTSILLQGMEISSIKIILKNWVAGNRDRRKAEKRILAFLNDPSASHLDLSHLKLTDLPDIFQCKELSARLESLSLSDNQLIVLPKEIGSLQVLRMLDISDNQLSTLPPEIGALLALKILFLSRNRLIALPKEISGLQALRALTLYSNHLTALPKEIGNLQALRTLELYNNQLAGLPQEVLNLPHACKVELTNSGLSPTVIERLRAAATAPGYQGPRISFSMQEREETDDEKTIQEGLAGLFATTKKSPREFPNLKREPVKAASLRSWLSRLSSMQDYKREGSLNDALANKILGYLILAEEDETFRNTFFSVIAGAAATCGDRMALSVLHLGIAHRRTTIDLTNMQDLAKFLIRGPWAIEQLETIAREKIPQLTFFDEIEVYLGYPIQLKSRLKLQIDVDGMLYFICSALTSKDIDDAESFIKAQLKAEDGRHNILVEDDTWMKALALNYPKEVRAIQDGKSKATEEAKTDDDYLAIDQEVKRSMVFLTKKALASHRSRHQEINGFSNLAAAG